jgi:DNA-binding NtrC family response regulator
LENVLERGVILTDSNETIGQEALFAVFPKASNQLGDRINADGALVQATDAQSAADWVTQIFEMNVSLEAVEEQLMRRAMELAQQNVSQAARILGLSRPALAYRLKKSGILDDGRAD